MQKGGDFMNNVELQKFIEVVQANEKLKAENFELRKENSALKKEFAAKELDYKFNLPAMYGCTPGNDEIRKEGEA